MPVKCWQTIVRFWFFLSYLITTVSKTILFSLLKNENKIRFFVCFWQKFNKAQVRNINSKGLNLNGQSSFLVGYYFEVGLVVIYATMCLPPRRVYYYPHGSTPLKILVVLLSFSHYFEQQFVSFCLASIHCQLDRTGLRVAF